MEENKSKYILLRFIFFPRSFRPISSLIPSLHHPFIEDINGIALCINMCLHLHAYHHINKQHLSLYATKPSSPQDLCTMSSLNTSDVHRIFKSLDQNGDGLLSLDELNWLLERTGSVHASLDELASLVGLGESGLDFNEFSLFYELISKKETHNSDRVEKCNDDEERDLYRAFEVFDLDGDGLISSQELQSVLRRLGMWDQEGGAIDCDKSICKFDVNGDGFLDFEEFKRMMLAQYY